MRLSDFKKRIAGLRPLTAARRFRSGAAWRRLARWYLARHPLCEQCLAEGRTTPAEAVHHIIPVEEAPDKALDVSNLRALCARHHALVHHQGDMGCNL